MNSLRRFLRWSCPWYGRGQRIEQRLIRLDRKADIIIDALDDLMLSNGDAALLALANRRLKIKTDALRAAIASATKPATGASDRAKPSR